MQICWLCLTCPSASFALQFGDFLYHVIAHLQKTHCTTLVGPWWGSLAIVVVLGEILTGKYLVGLTKDDFVLCRLKKIESSTYDGTDRRVIALITPHHPYSMDLFENHLYYTDWYRFDRGIRSMNKFNGSDEHKISSVRYWTNMGIRVYHPLRQPNGKPSFKKALHSFKHT